MIKPEYDYSKLKGKIKEVFESQEKFAEVLGISSASVSHKLNNKADWSKSEMAKSLELLGLDPSDIVPYFFALKVQKTELER